MKRKHTQCNIVSKGISRTNDITRRLAPYRTDKDEIGGLILSQDEFEWLVTLLETTIKSSHYPDNALRRKMSL